MKIPHTGIQYMDFVETFNISLDLSAIYLVGVELPFWIQVEYKIVLFYL